MSREVAEALTSQVMKRRTCCRLLNTTTCTTSQENVNACLV